MTVWRLIVREILHRKFNFGLGLLSVVVAVGCLVGAMSLLRAHDLQTEQIIAAKEAETAERMAKLEDDFRKITRDMGFNVLILPQNQNLGDLYSDDYASEYMPEKYVHDLANSSIVTVNHLLPSLQQKLKWPEQERTVILIGTRGEVPIMHRDPKKPIQDAVAPGTMVVGYELAQSLKLKPGDRTTLLGREFTVAETHGERGTKDDITIWINLKQAQELLDKPDQINAILALECHCEGDRLAQIRAEIAGILPDTQVIEFQSQALARAESRNRAAQEAQLALESEKRNRAALRSRQESFAGVLVPVTLAGCGLWLTLLSIANVRSRSTEIGILRALGVRSTQILAIFLQKAVLMGVLGAALGYAAGLFVAAKWGDFPTESGLAASVFDLRLLALSLILAPVLSVVAGWIPAVLAARQDPAIVLRED